MKHKRKLIRKKDHDYNWHGSYFITIFTKDKVDYFGSIDDLEMKLSLIGKIALDCWNEISEHFDDVELDEFVVMPNHVHGVIHLLPDERFDEIGNDLNSGDSVDGLIHQSVGTNHGLDNTSSSGILDYRSVGDADLRPLRTPGDRSTYNYDRTKMRLPKVVQQYKSSVTRLIRQNLNNQAFAWQRSYHDRIIRNEHELSLIRQYIHNNPINWHKDNYNPMRVNNTFNNKPISGKMI